MFTRAPNIRHINQINLLIIDYFSNDLKRNLYIWALLRFANVIKMQNCCIAMRCSNKKWLLILNLWMALDTVRRWNNQIYEYIRKYKKSTKRLQLHTVKSIQRKQYCFYKSWQGKTVNYLDWFDYMLLITDFPIHSVIVFDFVFVMVRLLTNYPLNFCK